MQNLGIFYTVADKISASEGIDSVRSLFSRLWFDEKKCDEGVRMLENYRKQWDDKYGRWSDKPFHDNSSNAADALRYLAVGLRKIINSGGSLKSDFEAARKFWGG